MAGGGFSFIHISLISIIKVTMWHNILPLTIEQIEICSVLEILKKYECSLKVKNLGFGHKMSAHANCKCNVRLGMGYMKEFLNNTTIVCSVNKRSQHVSFEQ
jgi:hypothetical protein